MTRAASILKFYETLEYHGELPTGIEIMNPYAENADIRSICKLFYKKYYDDQAPRKLILGINPGRLGAGATGIPFTDTKRLNENCEILFDKFSSHEPSSVFMYLMIDAFGGPKAFYKEFYISSICPLGFLKVDGKKTVNYNYYDSPHLTKLVSDFIYKNICTQIEIAGANSICYVLGTGKNFQYLKQINEKYHFFASIIPLEHPRYVMQYKAKSINIYIESYLKAFGK
jgi:hypothetical protein